MLSFIIQKGEAEQTLISFLKKRFKTAPRTLLYKLLRTQKIKVNGENIRYYHYRLKKGEKIEIYDNYLKTTPASSIIYPLSHSKIYFQTIYEDKNILIALKEHGITMPSLDNAVRNYIFKQNPIEYQKQQGEFFILTAVHRLDKLTKGLVIYPKNPPAKRILYKAISDKSKITKKYLAECENFQNREVPVFIQGYLGKDSLGQKMVFSLTPYQKAKYCAMEVKEIKREKSNHLVLFEITLQTGRKHQIRSALAYFGYPIVGDEKYGSKLVDKNKIGLVAYKITFNELTAPLAYLNAKEFQIKV
ncbi:MAG: RluA family pseudouridine synthase [Candidatus Moeniiplasma glomeromycotorum]|nr:RluA family pseudouridine synthase [Candidatus Moeniiplasma glomeromycotorum]MCE8162581.1 RluA family pseudouridine synthase [Candidatus Moeniiplasma glomeromycotorum]MCE8166495.1 RluA family pseudouridine synthase [Candidatus Moeniiplasma glomeromycotorum]MCE8166964.1 RluA family pseudouridine synthase [Candidatus Moeniiplasma glomeromycotorum]